MRKKDGWIVALAIFAALVLVLGQFTDEAIPTGAWGLSFRQEGQPPVGPVGICSYGSMMPPIWGI